MANIKFNIGDDVILPDSDETFATIVAKSNQGYIVEDVYGRMVPGFYHDDNLEEDV